MTTTRVVSVLSAVIAVLLNSTLAFARPDVDRDGIDDDLEDMLLQRYSPVFKYGASETRWPLSVLDFVRHSDLIMRYIAQRSAAAGCQSPVLGYSDTPVYTQAQLSANPTLILEGLAGVDTTTIPGLCKISDTSLATAPRPFKTWHLDLNDEWQNGVHPGADGEGHRGLYGHVYPKGVGEYGIQYWQFFGFNEARQTDDCGDHEGDILWLDVSIDAIYPYALRTITYHHHGSECGTTSLPFPGGSEHPSPVPLPADGIPVCYLEDRAHEWWPWPGGGECQFVDFPDISNPSHDGDGISYRVGYHQVDGRYVPRQNIGMYISNVGEWYSPRPGLEATLLLFFSGTWGRWGSVCDFGWTDANGDPPDSPMLQGFYAPFDWSFVNSNSGGDGGSDSGDGSAKAPWLTATKALNAGAIGGKVLFMPGSYIGVGTWSRPMTLSAPLGPASLGK